MKASVYLSSLHQDLIDNIRTEEEFSKIGNAAWTLCCDGFCCILDFSKFTDPRDLVANDPKPMSWYIRREEFGGLLWNPDTNRVFELDKEACDLLLTLQEGTGLERAAKKYGVTAAQVHSLMAQISETSKAAG